MTLFWLMFSETAVYMAMSYSDYGHIPINIGVLLYM